MQVLTGFAAIALQAGDTARADSTATTPAEEVVVTGERVPRSLRDTSSSVVLITGEQLETGPAFARLEDALASIPNVQLGSGGEGPTIRGQDTSGPMRDLPAFLGGTRPRTTLVVDGRAVSFNEFAFGVAPLWDVQRIEVFRTPQTTTQGRNSIAGAIFVHSRDPSDEWEARARAIASDLRTRQLSATASGPIKEDGLAFRLSGDWRKSRPASRIADRMRGADPDRNQHGLWRAKLLARPAAIRGGRIELTYAHSRSQTPQIEGVRAPFRKRRDPLDGYGVFTVNVDSLTAATDFNLHSSLDSRIIASAGRARIQRFAPPGLGETKIRASDWAVESMLDWNPERTLRLTGGLSVFGSALDQFIDLSALAGIGEFDDVQRSLGLFGEASWSTDRAELVAGLRYQHDRQVRSGALQAPSGAIPLRYRRDFDAWLPKLTFSYALTDRLNAGFLVQRAYNPGAATLRFDTGLADEVDAETLWNHELFARAALAPGLSARINLFRTDMRNSQRSRTISILAPSGAPVTFADLFNLASARSKGVEAELDWRAGPRFSARAAAGLLDTEVRRAGDGRSALEGNKFPRAPHFTAALAADWRPTDALRVSAQLRRNSGYFSDDENSRERHVGSSTTVDANASWSTGRVTLFGYARNLLDEFHMTYLFGPTFGTAGDPREVGIGVEARF